MDNDITTRDSEEQVIWRVKRRARAGNEDRARELSTGYERELAGAVR